jgi:hypothetical protein
MDTKELATATAHWLAYMKLSGYGALSSESLLIIPIAEYFRGKGWDVAAEVDCYELLEEKVLNSAGYVNYDVHAKTLNPETKKFETIILEMKFIKESTSKKKGTSNHSRLVTDFVKLAIPDAKFQWKRLAFVARDKEASRPDWLTKLMKDGVLELKIEREDKDKKVTLTGFEPNKITACNSFPLSRCCDAVGANGSGTKSAAARMICSAALPITIGMPVRALGTSPQWSRCPCERMIASRLGSALANPATAGKGVEATSLAFSGRPRSSSILCPELSSSTHVPPISRAPR